MNIHKKMYKLYCKMAENVSRKLFFYNYFVPFMSLTNRPDKVMKLTKLFTRNLK